MSGFTPRICAPGSREQVRVNDRKHLLFNNNYGPCPLRFAPPRRRLAAGRRAALLRPL